MKGKGELNKERKEGRQREKEGHPTVFTRMMHLEGSSAVYSAFSVVLCNSLRLSILKSRHRMLYHTFHITDIIRDI